MTDSNSSWREDGGKEDYYYFEYFYPILDMNNYIRYHIFLYNS